MNALIAFLTLSAPPQSPSRKIALPSVVGDLMGTLKANLTLGKTLVIYQAHTTSVVSYLTLGNFSILGATAAMGGCSAMTSWVLKYSLEH